MRSKIVVVGGGATALSFLWSLHGEAIRSGASSPLIIYVVEKRRLNGRGLAFDLDVSTNLLNTRAGLISPFSDRPGHFFDWLTANREKWEDEYPRLDVTPATFVPRSLFGLYLEYMMGDLVGSFAAIGIELVHVRDEVVSLEWGEVNAIRVYTDKGLRIDAQHAVLCCGNLQSSEFSKWESHPGFFSNPYPISRLIRHARAKQSVAILGARLSAIDVAVGLASGGFEGRMVMFSRSGYFPSVRGTQGRYTPSIMTIERLQQQFESHGPIRLPMIVDWMTQEMLAAGCPVGDLAKLPPLPPADVMTFYERDLLAAESPRPWQAVLYATNGVIDYLWQVLHNDDRAVFLSRYSAAWMAHRVSIPAENAARLVELAKAGRLTFRNGSASVAHDPSDRFTVTTRGAEDIGSIDYFDMVVGAMGTPRNVANLDSPLIQSLLESGLARGHEHGGLDVDPLTNALIDANGEPSSQISVLGELTSGIHFFTSVLEINARHAARLAKRAFRQYSNASEFLPNILPPSPSSLPHAGFPRVPMDVHSVG